MNNLRKIREEKEILQKDVAKSLGISRSAYSNYETGERSPDMEMVKRLADFYEVSTDEILDYSPKNNKTTFLQPEERLLLKKYRALSPQGRERALQQMDFELKFESKAHVAINAMEFSPSNPVAFPRRTRLQNPGA